MNAFQGHCDSSDVRRIHASLSGQPLREEGRIVASGPRDQPGDWHARTGENVEGQGFSANEDCRLLALINRWLGPAVEPAQDQWLTFGAGQGVGRCWPRSAHRSNPDRSALTEDFMQPRRNLGR
jgi:hypothetical protein